MNLGLEDGGQSPQRFPFRVSETTGRKQFEGGKCLGLWSLPQKKPRKWFDVNWMVKQAISEIGRRSTCRWNWSPYPWGAILMFPTGILGWFYVLIWDSIALPQLPFNNPIPPLRKKKGRLASLHPLLGTQVLHAAQLHFFLFSCGDVQPVAWKVAGKKDGFRTRKNWQ